MALTIGVAKETMPGETRVAIAPEVIRKLVKDGIRVVIETGAGAAAQMPDSDFAGAEIVADAAAVLQAADLLLTVQPPSTGDGRRPGCRQSGDRFHAASSSGRNDPCLV